MSSTISLSKSLRTTKVTPGMGDYAEGFRLFDVNPTCDIPRYLVDTYGRPTHIDASLRFEGFGAPGCQSSEYRIQIENILRPMYSEYLDVPEGLMQTQSEYRNRPRTDMLGVQRDRSQVFNIDGVYGMPSYPKGTNPNSETDFLNMQGYESASFAKLFDNRRYEYSADTQSGF